MLSEQDLQLSTSVKHKEQRQTALQHLTLNPTVTIKTQNYNNILPCNKAKTFIDEWKEGAFPVLSLLDGNKLKSSVIGDTVFGYIVLRSRY